MTNAEYLAQLAACNFRSPEQVSELVTASYTNTKFNEKVLEKHVANPVGAFNYFTGFFNTDVWPDGQGTDEVREYYADIYVPYTFSHFVRTMQICDPNLANECDTDYCQIPEGGRGTLPPIHMYKWGFETPRDCIANIRHIRNFQWWAERIIRSRELVDNQVMNMFYTMASIMTTGHKVLLQAYSDATTGDRLTPLVSTNPRNPFRGFSYNYMESLFPAPTDTSKIVPLLPTILEKLARHWTQFQNGNHVAQGSRGQLIWEFWTGDDWFFENAYNNPDYLKAISESMPSALFAGYSLNTPNREVIGNWAPRIMPWLPRLAESTEGGLVPVDSHEGVDIEVNQEFVPSRNFENAPFGLAVIPSKKQGTILKRPALTKSGAGFPILPITGDGNWIIRNDYDATCNRDLNKPYSQKRFEMGFRMDDPDAAMSIIYRRKLFRMQALEDCDLAPIFAVDPNTVNCSLTTIGCQDNKKRAGDSFTTVDQSKQVLCTAAVCGNGESGAQLYRIMIERKANEPGFNSLGIDCGDTVTVLIYDENGDFNRQEDAVVKDTFFAFPKGYYFIELTSALAAGECIKAIIPNDATDLQGNVVDCWDNTATGFEDQVGVLYLLDSHIGCEVGEEVLVTYYDVNAHVISTAAATLATADHAKYLYLLTGITSCTGPAGTVSVGVSCNSTSNSSSSSSSSSSHSSSSSSSSSSSHSSSSSSSSSSSTAA